MCGCVSGKMETCHGRQRWRFPWQTEEVRWSQKISWQKKDTCSALTHLTKNIDRGHQAKLSVHSRCSGEWHNIGLMPKQAWDTLRVVLRSRMWDLAIAADHSPQFSKGVDPDDIRVLFSQFYAHGILTPVLCLSQISSLLTDVTTNAQKWQQQQQPGQGFIIIYAVSFHVETRTVDPSATHTQKPTGTAPVLPNCTAPLAQRKGELKRSIISSNLSKCPSKPKCPTIFIVHGYLYINPCYQHMFLED